MLEGLSYTQVCVLKGKTLKTVRKIPLQCLTKQLVDRVDPNEMLNHGLSMICKMLLTHKQKDELTKVSTFKLLSDELLDAMENNQIMVRCESLTIGGKITYKTQKLNRDEVSDIIMTKGGKTSYHEIITSDSMRMVFDIDADYDQSELNSRIINEIGFLPKYQVLKNSHKEAYHIYYDVNLSVDYHKFIAEKLRKWIPSIDSGIYRLNGSLRLPNCVKTSTR